MKGTAIFLALALISTIAYSGVIVTQSTPTVTVTAATTATVKVQSPVVFQYGTITVPKQLWFTGLHAVAYKQLTYLYPLYKSWPVNSCAYTVYGPSRIYLFELRDVQGSLIKLFSSVQNNDQATGQQTQQAVEQQSKAQISADAANKKQPVTDQNSGFSVIKLSRAYEIPRIAVAIKEVTRSYWVQIRYAPLVRCLERWEKGSYNFRLYFNGIDNWFEYRHAGSYESKSDQIQPASSNLRAQVVSGFYEAQNNQAKPTAKPADDSDYLPRTQPIFSVRDVDVYGGYGLADFRKHPGYGEVSRRLGDHFGRFDQKWISKIQHRQDNDVHYFQIQVQFIPFLCNVDLEAHYYGSSQQASVLQIDEQIFSDKRYVDSWGEIKEFNSYKAFREANQYVLSQFTYLRFYNVTAAYSALHKNGRYVRLVYQSSNHLFSTVGQNQFNILVYICDGKYYIDRDDFQATNTYSFGRNDWLELFVRPENVQKSPEYGRIVNFFKTSYAEFWKANTIQQVRVKDGLYVVRFNKDIEENECVLSLTPKEVKVLNHFDWKLSDDKSVESSKATKYISKKFPKSIPLFVHSKVTQYGRHLEVSYLDQKRVFANAYLRYVESEDQVCEDEWQGVAYNINFDEIPLPEQPENHLIRWITDNDAEIVTVVEAKVVTKTSYQVVAVRNSQRWRINTNWARGQWVISNRQLLDDGYYFVTGYPSVNVASCSGYLARLYPTSFNSRWLYTSIELKNIGYFVYNRIIYRLGDIAYQGIVRTTHGVENSHTLISWDQVRHLVDRDDYGYGNNYDWSYGYDSRYFFDYKVQPVVKVDVKVVVNVDIDKTDLLCSYWDDDKCIACYGDYYADRAGRCVKVEDQCQFWQVSGNCSRCSWGWNISNDGKCVAAANKH